MARINYEKLRGYSKEVLSSLDQQIKESIQRETAARRQAIEDKKAKKLKRRKRKQRQMQNRD